MKEELRQLIRTILNALFRNNKGLLITKLTSKWTKNIISIGDGSTLKECKFVLMGGVIL